MQALLASLVVSMGVNDSAFKAGMGAARDEAKRTGQDFQKSGQTMSGAIDRAAEQINRTLQSMIASLAETAHKVQAVGLTISAAMVAPLAVIGKKSNDTAVDFQSAMNRVHAAMLNASPAELDKLRDAALALGPAMGRSAIETAGAIEDLAKNGMSAADILSGGLSASLKLATVGQTDLGAAANVTTDILQQFHLPVSQLPTIVDKVSGSLDASKLSFDGYKDAIAQVGGIAGGLGYSFDDMNTALAAIIPLMSAGSDAGTSFKAFLTALHPSSEQAKYDMEKLGIGFYNADGSAKSLGAVADVLRAKLSNLTDEKKTQALTDIFGSDGMRVAIALMQSGAKGIADMQAQIDKASADQKLVVLLDGEAQATARVSSAWEHLKIVIGNSGVVQAFTMIKNAAADVLDWLGSLPPGVYQTIAVIDLLGAAFLALAPFILKVVATSVLMRFGGIATGLAALVNPIGVALRLFAALAVQMGMTRVAALAMNAALRANAILAVGAAIYWLYQQYMTIPTASAAARAGVTAADKANAAAIDTTNQLATATGALKKALLEKAEADRKAALDALKKADADLVAAQAAYARAKAENANPMNFATNVGAPGAINTAMMGRGREVEQTRADLEAGIKSVGTIINTVKQLSAGIAAGRTPAAKKDNPDLTKPDGKKKGSESAGRDTSGDAADYAAKLADAQQEELDARADRTENAKDRMAADLAQIDRQRADYHHQLQIDEGITSEQADYLIAIKERALYERLGSAQQREAAEEAQKSYDISTDISQAQQDILTAQIGLATTANDRRDLEMQLLAKQKDHDRALNEKILASTSPGSAESDIALTTLKRLDAVYADKAKQKIRDTEGPGESYMRSLNQTSGQIAETVQSGAVDALKDLNTGLSDAILGAKSLADAFADMGKRIIASLLDIAIQQTVIKPLAATLFGGTGGGGGLIGSIGAGLGSLFGGGRATGGAINADRWYTVGERGPERFYPGISGTVVPNGGRGAMLRSQPAVVQLSVGAGQMFEQTVRSISGDVSVQTIGGAGRAQSMRARQTLR